MFKRLTSHYVNLITSGLYVSLLLACFFFDDLAPAQLSKLIVALIVIALFAFAFNFWRYLAIAKAPVSSIAAAAQGYVELNGIAKKAPSLHTPLHGIPCVWYRSWAYARDHRNLWRLVDYTDSDAAFELVDESGVCTVNPKGAEVMHMQQRTSFKNNHRYIEHYLPNQKPLYLIGHLDTRHHFTSEADIRTHMGTLISEWKSNPTEMLLRFDLDRDGEIDLDEWEKARKQAREEVEREQMNKAHTGGFEMSAPSNGQLYLLSGMSPDALRQGYRSWVMIHLAALVALLIAARLV